ncbi:terminase large subunit domain-containing protein [Acetobacter estunensis]|uniref:terminase large subunit domain-containing protein n=1 Tax=Acetobacter estunensis TaxID=104097 RepID=UPI001C2DAB0D|nr:terminase large subunit [Acetobacter estunensis]MBV1837181.1 terminase family protein [Acetobacter estunensis]
MADLVRDMARDLRHALDPVLFARERLGFEPDPWQANVLGSTRNRILLNCTRQAGKTTTTSVLALHTGMYHANSLILLFSKAQRQSSELLAKVQTHINTMDGPPKLLKEAATEIKLANGSRIVSLPGDGDNIRGYSAPNLIVEDEAAFVHDSLYEAFLPMLATSNGRLVLMSTPNGKQGHFYNAWAGGDPKWQRESVTAEQVSRISPEYLEDMRSEYGPWKFEQEFHCKFVEADDQFFSDEAIERAFSRDVPLLELNF